MAQSNRLRALPRTLSGRLAPLVAVSWLTSLAACGGGGSGDDSGGIPNNPPPGSGGTGSATLTWDPPTENTDGSALVDLAGYKIIYGTAAERLDSHVTVSNPGISSYVVDNLTKTTWHFAVVAVNKAGVQSAPSNRVSKQIS